jgi:uncharacterized Zn finger protein (UPF0148 family)
MPSFNLDFEVFCGLCQQSDTRESRSRNYPQVTVEACHKCVSAARDGALDECNRTISELESKIAELESRQEVF